MYGARIRRALKTLLVVAAAAPGAAPQHPLIPRPVATIVEQPCPSADPDVFTTGICTDSSTHTIYAPANADKFAIEHEFGHVFDRQRLDDGERIKLARVMGMPGRKWQTGTGLQGGLQSPSERFADAYAACRMRLDPETKWESAYDYQPSRRQHAQVCATIARAAD